MTDIEKLAKKIGGLTQNNNHNESVLELAKFLKDEEAIDKIQAIKVKHMQIGHMPYELIEERMAINKSLLNQLKLTHGKEARDKIYSKF